MVASTNVEGQGIDGWRKFADVLNEAKAPPEPKSQPDDRWSQEQAADLEADKKLTKQLKICNNC